MNFLFSVMITLLPLLLLVAACHVLTVMALKHFVQPQSDTKYQLYRKGSLVGFRTLAVVLTVLVLYSSVQTFGVRVKLEASNQSYTPERSQVESTDQFTETPEWRGKFDQRIDQEPNN